MPATLKFDKVRSRISEFRPNHRRNYLAMNKG